MQLDSEQGDPKEVGPLSPSRLKFVMKKYIKILLKIEKE